MAGLWKIAIRDLRRNKRRSAATLVATLLGVAMLVALGGLMEGMYDQMVADNIRVQTSHLQIRDPDYDRDRASLQWEDLLDDAEDLAARVRERPEVQDATPILWTSGVVGLREESVNVAVIGMDLRSNVNAPFRAGLVAGALPASDDREGVLMGRRLAESLDIGVGDDFSLLVPTSGEQPDEVVFTVRGLYDSGIPSYDMNTLLMPLDKAQSFTRTEGRASAIKILLQDREQADDAAAVFAAPELEVLTWRDLNAFLLDYEKLGRQIIYLLYLVILAIVAVVIVNTLMMTVLERTREMGILAALGMKAREIRRMFLIESGVLALIGIVSGVGVGSLMVEYLSVYGINISDAASAIDTTAFAIGETMYAAHSVPDTILVSVMALVVTLIGSIYPAWYASRKEPVEALRTF